MADVYNADFWENMIGKPFSFFAIYKGANEEVDSDTVTKYDVGKKRRYMVLEDVRAEDGTAFRTHVWLPFGKRFRQMGMMEYDRVAFTAKIRRYIKQREGWGEIKRLYGGYWMPVYDKEVMDKCVVQYDLQNITDFRICWRPSVSTLALKTRIAQV